MTFGEKLQLLRKQNGMSQENLASQLTVSRQAISKWELNSSLPDTENVIQLSELFGVSIDYLLKEEVDSLNVTTVSTVKNKKEKYIYLGGIGCFLFSTVSYFVVWILSKIYPAPIVYQDSVTKDWKVGLENFIWVHGLETFMFLLGVIFAVGIGLILHKQIKKIYGSIILKLRKVKR